MNHFTPNSRAGSTPVASPGFRLDSLERHSLSATHNPGGAESLRSMRPRS